MRHATLIAAALSAALSACASAPTAPSEAQGPSLLATLGQELAAPVALLPGAEDGLCAMGSDGTERCFVEGQVDWTLVDHRAQVVWFGAHGELRFLDLLQAAPAPETLATGLPTDFMSGPPGVVIAHGPDDADRLWWGHPGYPRVVVDLPARGLACTSRTFPVEEFAPAVEAISAAIPERLRARLAHFAARGAGRPLHLARPEPAGRVTLPPLDEPCEGDVCGEAWTLPGTPFLRVATSYACGDACHVGWSVYDPAAKALVAGDWTASLRQATLSADGRWLVAGGRVLGVEAGPLGQSRGEGGGWLSLGVFLP